MRKMFGGTLACCGLLIAATAASGAELKDLVPAGAEARKVVGDCKFTEGPAWSPQGFLLFSDIPNSRIVRVDSDEKVSDFLKPSGGSNGLAFDREGNLYACQGTDRRVVKIGSQGGKVEVLSDSFDGKPLNSPNDLALDGHGGLYFTDPRYGADTKIDQPVMGVYYIDADGRSTRVIDKLQRPNGILVAPDGKSLYVAEPNLAQLWKYEITAPGKLSEGKLIFTGDAKLDGGGPDGMALDQHGNIYATYAGIVVLSPAGELIGRIPVPERPANCKFGGADGKTLYITARTSLYALAMNVAGPPTAAAGPRPAAKVTQRQNGIPVRLVSFAQDKPAAEAKEVKIEDITLKTPAGWKQEPPSNRLRLAQFKIPAVEGDKDPAELVVSSFAGGGGGIDPNLERWVKQFQSDGRKVKITVGACPQGDYYLSDISGTFNRPIGPPIAGRTEAVPGSRSLGVILVIAKGDGKEAYFLKLTGPEKTVAAAADGFRASFGGDAAKEKPYEK